MSARLIDLNAETYFLANEALAELQELKIPHAVTSTKRTLDEQAALYLQGRAKINVVNAKRNVAGMHPISEKENTYTVTNCDGVRNKSNHQSGDALDIVPLEGTRAVWPSPKDPRWLSIAEVMERHGFEWGGRWKNFPDFPHYQRKT
jgi:peptidoglycan L-alanyl-D-glutamate endopeptidase CwlK